MFIFKEIRNERLDEVFDEILDDVKELCTLTDTLLATMRTTGRQAYRANAPAQTPEEYYRINLFIPLLDHFIISLTDRFSKHQWMAYRASALIPSLIENKCFNDLKDCIGLYEDYLPSASTIKEEFELYKRKWMHEARVDRPNNAIDAYVNCNGIFFPNIKVLLQRTGAYKNANRPTLRFSKEAYQSMQNLTANLLVINSNTFRRHSRASHPPFPLWQLSRHLF